MGKTKKIGFLLRAFLLSFLVLLSYNKYKKYPQKINEYWGIKLGDHAEDIAFYKGHPTYMYKNFFDQLNRDQEFKPLYLDIENDFHHIWYYIEGNREYKIYYANNKTVKQVICGCAYKATCDSWICPKVSSVGINSSFEDVIEVFGYPNPVNYEKRYGLRFLKYSKYNVTFRLKENKVYHIIYEQE